MSNHSIKHQCAILLAYLQKVGSATTIDIRHKLDILAPAPRIYELRHEQGHNIVTTWENDENPHGTTHRVARYVLKAGKFKEAKR